MKYLIELALYAATLACLIGGMAAYAKVNEVAGMALITLGCMLGVGSVYLLKFRPFQLASSKFDQVFSEFGFLSVEDKRRTAKAAAWVLRQFEFNDVSVRVDGLLVREDACGVCWAGKYYESGQGLHFGFFVTGLLEPLTKEDELQLEDNPNLIIEKSYEPSRSKALAIEQYPYDFSSRGITFLSELEPKQVLEPRFSKSVERLLSNLV